MSIDALDSELIFFSAQLLKLPDANSWLFITINLLGLRLLPVVTSPTLSDDMTAVFKELR